jgi:hypothetical protein
LQQQVELKYLNPPLNVSEISPTSLTSQITGI